MTGVVRKSLDPASIFVFVFVFVLVFVFVFVFVFVSLHFYLWKTGALKEGDRCGEEGS